MIAAIGLVAVLVFCISMLVFISPEQFKRNTDRALSASTDTSNIKPVTQSQSVSDERLREDYLDALTEYTNSLKPELDKIDLLAWNKARSEQLTLLEDKALSEFTTGDYANALTTMSELSQLAQTTLSDSRQAFEHALSTARKAYHTDQYDEAKLQVTQALMLDKTSDAAVALADRIDNMPEILRLIEQIKAARVENNPAKELKIIQKLLSIAPDRGSVVKRKQTLVHRIRQSTFNAAIAQTYKALKRGNVQVARRKIAAAKKLFPQRQEINEASMALQTLVKKQHLDRYRQAIGQAIAADDWVAVKRQATLALQQRDTMKMQKTLTQATTIVALTNTLDEALKHPYRLTNQQFVSRLNTKLGETSLLSGLSPSLSRKAEKLPRLIQQVNHKIQVEVSSDSQTTILVRGVGKIGKTRFKTIHLLPGQYTFEGKRKGFKSKLIKLLIPYDTNSIQIAIRCDEPI